MQSHWKYIMRFSLSVLLLFFSVSLFAQEEEEENECVRTLNKAQKAYEDGLIEKIDQMVRPCLNSGQLSKEEQMQAYRLLALAKLYDGKDDEAEEAMLEFLKLDPEYQLQPGVDPKEFSELYGNYHTSPLYTIGIYLGPNWALAKPYKEYGAYNTDSDKKTYSSNVRFQFGLRATRYIYKGLNVHLDLAFSQTSFNYTHDILESYTTSDPFTEPNSSPSKGVTIESTEDQTSFLIPVSFSYTFLMDKKVRPYVLAGFETRYLFTSANSLLKTYFDQDIAAVEVASVENFIDTRNKLTFSGIFGAGAKLKIPRGDLFIEAKYNLGFSDQVKKDAFTSNEDVRLWSFYEQDNDFTLDNIQLNIGYNLYLYKPRKMKQVKPEKEAKAPKEPKEPKVKEEKPKKSEDKAPSKQRQVIE